MTLPQPLGSAPKYEIRNLLVEAFHGILNERSQRVGFGFHNLGPSEGVGQGHHVKKLMFFKGSHVVYQMKGLDE
jgi:hypothetical protein